MVKLLLAVPGVILMAVGLEGVYNGYRSGQTVALTCEQFRQSQPVGLSVRLTGCAVDYDGAAYRESDGVVRELFLPIRPAGAPPTQPAPIVAVTHAPAALAIAGRVVGERTQGSDGSSTMQKAAAAAGLTNEVHGVVRAGLINWYTSRLILSGLSTPLAADVVLVDVNGAADMIRPAAMVAAGVGLALIALFTGGRPAHGRDPRNRVAVLEGPRVAGADPIASSSRDAYAWQHAAIMMRLPQLMLLNLDASAGLEAIETAPPMGTRDEVLARLREILPDLEVDVHGRATHRGPDHDVRIDVGRSDPVHTVTIDARGRTGASVVRWLLDSTGWRAFAPRSGRFMDAEELAEQPAGDARPSTHLS